MDTRTYRVEGMTCASCVRRVEKALAGVPGVRAARVNLATEEAVLELERQAEPETTQAVARALEARGYHLGSDSALVAARERAAEVRRAWMRAALAWIATLPLMLAMPPLHLHLPWIIQAGLSAIAAFGAGWPFLSHAARQALRGETSMDTLVALGASVSWGFAIHEGLHGSAHPPFETAAALVAFLLVGKALEAKARRRATGALEELLKLAPAMALRLERENGREEECEVPTEALQTHDVVRVKPGGVIPVDGVVLAGQADVAEAMLTGEPMPIPKSVGDHVIAGAIVHGGALDIQVEGAGQGTWLARLARQVAEAQGSRAPSQAMADRISSVFVPAILALSSLTLIGWWMHTGSLALAWRPAVTVLVIACPCALGLATPVAMATALGTAARQGLLVRDASAMERLACLTDLALDKTGTLTEGRPSLLQVLPTSNLDAAALLRIAAALERGSEHPIAKGILAAAGPSTVDVQSFQAHPGGGVSGVVEDRRLRLGGAGFLGVTLPDVAPEWANATLVGLAEDQRLLGVFVLTDAMKSDTPALVASLKTRHLHLHLLSGDRPEAVRALALRLGIEDALGGCSPDTKRDRIAALQAQGRVVAFLGDGVNDALALAQADAGIALPGLEAAQASAPLNLLREGLAPLVSTLDLARRTRVVIRQNLAWAFGYNLLLVPLAAFNQLDRFGGPMLAGAAMGLSSLTVVLNALRLRRSA